MTNGDGEQTLLFVDILVWQSSPLAQRFFLEGNGGGGGKSGLVKTV